MIAYKFLRRGGTSPFTGFAWPLPDGGPGPWLEAFVEPCRSGIHACRRDDLPLWLGPELYEMELDGEIVGEPTKLVASRARLLQRIDAWDDRLRDDYTRMCVDRAHDLAAGASPPLTDWDAVIEPSIPEGPALLGFVAARIAEARGGRTAYHEERKRQARWLADRLSLRESHDV
jgi:hypothetical protein